MNHNQAVRDLVMSMTPSPVDCTLASGSSGAAVASAAVGVSENDGDLQNRALEHLEAAVVALAEPQPMGLFDGVAGLMSSIRITERLLGEVPTPLRPLKEGIYEGLSVTDKETCDLDLLVGIAGVGLAIAYCASDDDHELELAIHRLIWQTLRDRSTDGHSQWLSTDTSSRPQTLDLGLAHGTAGIAAYLAVVGTSPSLSCVGDIDLYKSAAHALLDQMTDNGLPSFADDDPAAVHQSTWCYGALGGLLALTAADAHRALEPERRRQIAQSARRLPHLPLQEDPLPGGHSLGLCHGLAGRVAGLRRLSRAALPIDVKHHLRHHAAVQSNELATAFHAYQSADRATQEVTLLETLGGAALVLAQVNSPVKCREVLLPWTLS
jgi:hypothetical protein